MPVLLAQQQEIWGVMMVIQIELAMIHPPFGVIVFVLHGLAPDIPMRTIYVGLIPFLIADCLFKHLNDICGYIHQSMVL